MHRLPPAMVVLLCLTATACRTDPNLVLLERELRLQEDRIWDLTWKLEDSQRDLERCHEENEALRDRLGRPAQDPPRRLLRTPPGGDEPVLPDELDPPREAPPSPREPSRLPERLRPPAVELPPPDAREQVVPDRFRLPERIPVDEPDDLEESRGPALGPRTEAASLRGSGDPDRVAQITLHEALTVGGREGLRIMVEPRNAAGQLVPMAAPIAVAVLDPEQPGERARIARWDFSAEEAAEAYYGTSAGEGIYLAMPWPQTVPGDRRLHLFVRFTTPDGRRLETDQPLDLSGGVERASRWSSADAAAAAGLPGAERDSPESAAVLETTPPAPLVHDEAARPLQPRQRPDWSPLRD